METVHHCRIGLLNDLHYDGGIEGLNRLYESVASLNQGDVNILVVLGDLIDSAGEMNAQRLLREVSALCGSFRGPVCYMPGNHDLDHLSKTQFYDALESPENNPLRRLRIGGCELVCIDGNFSPDGMDYEKGNFEWNQSCIPDEQLTWLRDQLNAAKEPVVLLTHQRIDIPGDYSVQNHASVREVIQESGKVKAVFQAHQHSDDLKQVNGITYYTLAAHKDDAGPAVVQVDSSAIRLMRDFSPAATASLST